MSKAGRWWRSYKAECDEWSRLRRPQLPEAIAIERSSSVAMQWLRRLMEGTEPGSRSKR
jgi:hypothetical protein